MKSEKRKIGDYGEDLACLFLENQGLKIKNRNYLEKWGEIDIIAKKNKILYFLEIKTLSFNEVIHETFKDVFPEEQITTKKAKKLKKAIGLYQLKNNIDDDIQFAVIAVVLDSNNSNGEIRFYPEIVL